MSSPESFSPLWYEHQRANFVSLFTNTMQKVGTIVNSTEQARICAPIEVNPNTAMYTILLNGDLPNNKTNIAEVMLTLGWQPVKKSLSLANILLMPHLQNQGYGIKILQKLEELGKAIGAEEFSISLVTNPWFEQHLPQRGYTKDTYGNLTKKLS